MSCFPEVLAHFVWMKTMRKTRKLTQIGMDGANHTLSFEHVHRLKLVKLLHIGEILEKSPMKHIFMDSIWKKT